ncbi:MAG TPA: hypothetical protein VN761_12385 [Candidatus Polarisedimenticolia bacterium]|nr:hypothetical protein [Candidatus Polarisedimenticolia bacterium]
MRIERNLTGYFQPRNHNQTRSAGVIGKLLSGGLLLLGCCLLATGCAFSRTETQVNFVPKVSEPLKAEKASLTVGEIKDSRSVNDPNVLIHKSNAYGPTSGAYVTKSPVAEILKNGVADALKQNGFVGADAGKYELRGDLQEFSLDPRAGVWEATVNPKLVVRFELVEKGSGEPVWHDTFIGHAIGKTAWGDKEFLSRMFSESADDLTKQLIEDKTFRGFLEQPEGSPVVSK